MRKVDSVASVYFNGSFYRVVTMSQGMLDYGDPLVPWQYLPPGCENLELGTALRAALNQSKRVNVEVFQEIWKSRIVQQVGAERNAWELKHYGYKSKRAMYQNMMCCWIRKASGQIEIKPTLHKGLDAYSGISKDGPEIIHLSDSVSDTELGAALREGFRRCTGNVK